MSPAEATLPSLRRSHLPNNPELNNNMIKDSLDFAEGSRDQALLRIQNYQQLAAKYYNKKTFGRHFAEGDLVLRKVFENTSEANAGKLSANWKGPYIIVKIVKPGVYQLVTMAGTEIPRSWNSMKLKRFYY
uniref:Uncharacterized protein n=1 Tax=Noccaea caerulescens TaxID=107243 RepID=A0A1J3J877_NOCCA